MQVLALTLPEVLARPEAVHTASVHVELLGGRLGDSSGFIRRAGRQVPFGIRRTLPLERGSRPFAKLRDTLVSIA